MIDTEVDVEDDIGIDRGWKMVDMASAVAVIWVSSFELVVRTETVDLAPDRKISAAHRS